LNRQLLDRSKIDAPKEKRVFTIYRYEVTTINSSKSNPCFYADIWGDWREEIIQVTSDQTELRLFTTWYPTDYKFPYLMSDHVYEMSALNQNIGYNQPTQLGYYLGSDLYKK
jgi:rhamnogalacturonan endolyase